MILPMLVYKFGSPGVAAADAAKVAAQFRAANEFKRRLLRNFVEAQQARKVALMAYHPGLAALEAAWDAADQEIEKARQAIRSWRYSVLDTEQAKAEAPEELRAALAAAKDKRKEISAARKQVWAKVKNDPAWVEIQRGITSAMYAADKQANAEYMDLVSPTTRDDVNAAVKASRAAFFNNMFGDTPARLPDPDRPMRGGRLLFRKKNAKARDLASWEVVTAEEWATLKGGKRPKRELDEGVKLGGGRPREPKKPRGPRPLPDPNSKRSQRRAFGVATFRLASFERQPDGTKKRAPTVALVPFIMHRPLPEGVKPVSVSLVRTAEGASPQDHVSLTMPVPARPLPAAPPGTAIGVALGVKSLGGGRVRVAACGDLKGPLQDIYLPERVVTADEKSKELLTILRRKFNEARKALNDWREKHGTPEWMAPIVARWRPRPPQTTRDDQMGPWRPGELLALMRQWQPTPGDEEPVTLANGTTVPLYNFLREWVGKELHIRDWAVNITAKQVRQRQAHFREVAVALATRYATIVIDGADLSKAKTKKNVDQDVGASDEARAKNLIARLAAPGDLRTILISAFQRAGGRVMYAPAKPAETAPEAAPAPKKGRKKDAAGAAPVPPAADPVPARPAQYLALLAAGQASAEKPISRAAATRAKAAEAMGGARKLSWKKAPASS